MKGELEMWWMKVQISYYFHKSLGLPWYYLIFCIPQICVFNMWLSRAIGKVVLKIAGGR